MKKRILSLILAAGLLMSGCSTGKKQETIAIDDSNFFDFNQYKDCDDIPDWKGEKVNLVVWGSVNSPNDSAVGKIASDDVVTPEIERITGVTFDKLNSYDNGGGSYDSQIAKIIAADDYPDMAYYIPDLKGLVDNNSLWRLDEIIEEYCPNIYKLFGPDSKIYGDQWKMQMEKFGGVYSISLSSSRAVIRDMVELDHNYEEEGFTEEQLISLSGIDGVSPYGMFYLREDILKKLYPDAHTNDELQQIFEERGYFTEEEIFDVPLNTREDFIDMLYKIKDMGITDGKQTIYPIYSHTGADNWPALTLFSKMMGYEANYFSYYDLQDKCIKYTFKEPWFKDVLKTWNQLIRDGVSSKEALVDTQATFNEKFNSGKFAVTISTAPSEEALGGRYTYRPVYVKYRYDETKFPYFVESDALANRVSFFNKNLDKSQIVQVLRMVDFLASDPGQKLTYWGPRSAGLYTEEADGKLKYTDKDLEAELSRGVSGKTAQKYNLDATAWPKYPKVTASKYFPRAYYTKVQRYGSRYTPAMLGDEFKAKTVIGNQANIYQTGFTAEIPECANFWAARQGFENALLKTFAASTDAEFETCYQAVLDYAEKYGLTDETLKKCNDYYVNDLNSMYMKNLQ